MIREDQGPEADVATALVDVADQLRVVATPMNSNAVGGMRTIETAAAGLLRRPEWRRA